jgi:aspartate 1-decarboxylase
MLKTFCAAKIHRATITSINLDYEGSITIDSDLLEKAGIQPYEQVHVLNVNNGQRFVTYAIKGETGSGEIQVNGAAAHLCEPGDLIIIVSYCQIAHSESFGFKPTVVNVDSQNRAVELTKVVNS